MTKLNEFMDYFNAHHTCLYTSEKKVSNEISSYFAGVSEDRIDLITKKIKTEGVNFLETSSGVYNPFFKHVRFPFKNSKEAAFHKTRQPP